MCWDGEVPAQPIQTPARLRQPASRAVANPPELRSTRGPPACLRMSTGKRFETLITRPLISELVRISVIVGLLQHATTPEETGAVHAVVAARHRRSWDGTEGALRRSIHSPLGRGTHL